MRFIATGLLLLCASCALDDTTDDDPTLGETEGALVASNKLASNKLASNKLASNKLASNKLASNSLNANLMLDTADAREVLSYIVGCALPTGQTLTLTAASGTSYDFPGWIGLAPAWATRLPTVTERRWVTACVLARTNLYGIPVDISMRHDTNPTLATTAAERTAFPTVEGGFYGDLFAPVPVMYACDTRAWTEPSRATPRACALSPNGVTTDCGFTYTGRCHAPTGGCADKTAPFSGCLGASVSYNEVITIFLK